MGSRSSAGQVVLLDKAEVGARGTCRVRGRWEGVRGPGRGHVSGEEAGSRDQRVMDCDADADADADGKRGSGKGEGETQLCSQLFMNVLAFK